MRIEEDFLGKVEVPDNAYYGVFSVRAGKCFSQISGNRVPKELIRAVALIKKCAALTNSELGKLDQKKANAISKASDEVMEGKFDSEFLLDIFQAGAGTPLHMNTNEVIANRAEEILGGKKGEYKLVHSNNDVNMSQSSNDVVPTAIRIASIWQAEKVIEEAEELQKILTKKAQKYKSLLKIGRTHLQDAVPMTYGQTFLAWSKSIEKDVETIAEALESVRKLGIGGTATGSGITAHPKFRERIVQRIAKEARIRVEMASDSVETTQSMNDLLKLSAALRAYASTVNRMANDVRLLVSGPKGGINELSIPEIEPGSSIMPGKINPSIPETVNMICWKVMGNDQAVLMAANSGQLELNFATPLIAQCLLESCLVLERGTKLFREKCVDGLEVNEKQVTENFKRSLCSATAFNPYLGYSKVSKLVREALEKNVSIADLIVEKEILSRKDVDLILQIATGPALVNEEIKKRVKV